MLSTLLSDHTILVAVLTLSSSLTAGLFGTLKWYMWRRTKLEANVATQRYKSLVSFEKDVERLASEGKDTRIALRENTASTSKLGADVAVLQVQVGEMQTVLPKTLTLLEKINDRFESRLPQKLEAAEIAPDVTKIKDKKENQG